MAGKHDDGLEPVEPEQGFGETRQGRHQIMIGDDPVGGMVRRVRRRCELSQRELAEFIGVSPALIASIETGRAAPSLTTLQRILSAAGLRMVVCDDDGRLVPPLQVWQDVADGAGRRYPAHLDTILDPAWGEWWADVYGLAHPPETFRRTRRWRERQREISQWEVRVAQFREARRPKDLPRSLEWPEGAGIERW